MNEQENKEAKQKIAEGLNYSFNTPYKNEFDVIRQELVNSGISSNNSVFLTLDELEKDVTDFWIAAQQNSFAFDASREQVKYQKALIQHLSTNPTKNN